MDVATRTHLPALGDLLRLRRDELLARLERAPGRCEAADAPLGAVGPATAGDAPAQSHAHDLAELERTEAALARLLDPHYGDCLQCLRPIPLQRLLVDPAAQRCAACQAVFDSALRR